MRFPQDSETVSTSTRTRTITSHTVTLHFYSYLLCLIEYVTLYITLHYADIHLQSTVHTYIQTHKIYIHAQHAYTSINYFYLYLYFFSRIYIGVHMNIKQLCLSELLGRLNLVFRTLTLTHPPLILLLIFQSLILISISTYITIPPSGTAVTRMGQSHGHGLAAVDLAPMKGEGRRLGNLQVRIHAESESESESDACSCVVCINCAFF